jgi:toxin HigB-1
MIKSWKHKELKRFFETGNKSGIMAAHEKKLKIILQRLCGAIKPEDMHTPGMQFHKLTGNLARFYSVSVSVNWRIVFRFNGQDAEEVNYIDYH